jgi:hypothetical protein
MDRRLSVYGVLMYPVKLDGARCVAVSSTRELHHKLVLQWRDIFG